MAWCGAASAAKASTHAWGSTDSRRSSVVLIAPGSTLGKKGLRRWLARSSRIWRTSAKGRGSGMRSSIKGDASSGQRAEKSLDPIRDAAGQLVRVADEKATVDGAGQIAHLDDGLRYAWGDRVTVAPRIERVVVAHAQAD